MEHLENITNSKMLDLMLFKKPFKPGFKRFPTLKISTHYIKGVRHCPSHFWGSMALTGRPGIPGA